MKRIVVPMILVLGICLFVRIAKGQAQWTPIKRITWNSGNSFMPAIAVDSSGNLHVVWDDDTPGNDEIYYRKYVQ